jgi:hypothetical protein
MAANRDVRLNEMESLFDLGLFPLPVCAGAVVNVVAMLVVTRLIRHWFDISYRERADPALALTLWIAVVLEVNLLPVLVLRAVALRPAEGFRRVREMSFLADQHRFPLWVYGLASLNMAAWIGIGWVVFGQPDNPPVHLALLVAAVVVTGFPAWIRLFRR